MLEVGISLAAAAAARPRGAPGGGPPAWPEGAVALWLVLGQSNAEGYAPVRQDPARATPAAATDRLSAAERTVHPWVRFSTRGAGATAGQFPAAGQGLGTATSPRTSGRVWTGGTLGIPEGTPSVGPELGLVRHVLSGAAPATWRDDASPRLYVFKQVEGGRSVDHFRWGGPGQGLLLTALRQAGGENLTSLAAARTVLLQGVIFVIGDRDATDLRPDGGGSMAGTLAARFADWVRQLRAALGVPVPVLFVESIDTVDANKVASNAALAALAAALPDAVVVERQADWSDVGDGVHYDVQGQDRLGAAAFGAIRAGWGRPADGLVTAFPFTGLKPWFHVPPFFVRDLGTAMRIGVVPAMSGVVHARVTAEGAAAPSAEEIRDRSDEAGGFSRSVTADQDLEWQTATGVFASNVTQDCHFVLEGADGTLGERVTVRRGGNVKFAPDLAFGSATASGAVFTLRPSFTGVLRWSLLPGTRGLMRPEDVDAMAFLPVQAGTVAVTANADVTLTLSGLAAATGYTLFVTGVRTSDGLRGVTRKESFATL